MDNENKAPEWVDDVNEFLKNFNEKYKGTVDLNIIATDSIGCLSAIPKISSWETVLHSIMIEDPRLLQPTANAVHSAFEFIKETVECAKKKEGNFDENEGFKGIPIVLPQNKLKS